MTVKLPFLHWYIASFAKLSICHYPLDHKWFYYAYRIFIHNDVLPFSLLFVLILDKVCAKRRYFWLTYYNWVVSNIWKLSGFTDLSIFCHREKPDMRLLFYIALIMVTTSYLSDKSCHFIIFTTHEDLYIRETLMSHEHPHDATILIITIDLRVFLCKSIISTQHLLQQGNLLPFQSNRFLFNSLCIKIISPRELLYVI